MKTLRKKILRLYGEDTTVADDDLLLISRVWAMEGWEKDLSIYQNLKHVTNPASIIRQRAKLIEEGKIKASEPVQAFRMKKDKQMRGMF